MEKSIFESKDTQPVFAVAEEKSEAGEKYAGPNRRKDDRRESHERRGDVRFELNSSDRRQNPGGRRNDDVSVNFW